jgi:hypothetical protein
MMVTLPNPEHNNTMFHLLPTMRGGEAKDKESDVGQSVAHLLFVF